jgi:hypothetical protein
MSNHTPDDELRELRGLLDDAVADVHPAPALSAIRNRTKVTPMNRHRTWLTAAAAAVAVSAATVTTVVLTGDDGGRPDRAGPAATADPTPDESADAGDDTATPDPAPSNPPSDAEAVPVYYVGETPAGPRLFREFHRLTVPDDAAGTAKAALVEALSSSALDPDYRTPWAGLDIAVGLVTRAGDTVVVDLGSASYGGDLRERPLGMSKAEADMAVEQLVHTVQAVYQEPVPVQVLLQGDPIDTLLGVPVSEPLAAGDPMQVQAPVWIIEPQEGSTGNGFVVTGRGAFFEANVAWELLEGDRVVDEGFATAEECCTLAPFSFRVDAPAPGDYTLRVYDADMSGGEGNGEAEDTKRLTFR